MAKTGINRSPDKRGQLEIAAGKVQWANAVLMSDEGELGPGWRDEDIAEAYSPTVRSLGNWRKQADLTGPLSILERQTWGSTKRLIFDGEKHRFGGLFIHGSGTPHAIYKCPPVST